MGIEVVFVVCGAVLLLTAIVGGGFEIQQLRVPRVGTFVRVLSGLAGFVFVLAGVAFAADFVPKRGPEVAERSTSPPSNNGGPSGDQGEDGPGDSENNDPSAGDDVVQHSEPSGEDPPADDPPTPSGFFQQQFVSDGGLSNGAYTYRTITDDTGILHVDVPSEWGDVDGRSFTDDAGYTRLDVRAASDLDAFHSRWDVAGLIVSASANVSDEGLDAFADRRREALSEECTWVETESYDDGVYVGFYDLYTDCGGSGSDTEYVVVTAMPDDATFLIGAEIQIVSDRDYAALDRMIDSFLLDEELANAV